MTDVPQPTAEGSLTKTPFAHVLLYVQQHGMSGTLVVWPEEGQANQREDRVLMRAGVIVAALLAEPASSIERGLLPLFVRTNAPYAFYSDVNLLGSSDGVRTGRVDPISLVTASLRGSVREDAVESVLGKLSGVKLRIKSDVDIRRFEFQPRELTFIDVVRAEPITPEQIATASGLPEKVARRLLYLLAITKAVEPYTPSTTASARRPSNPFMQSAAAPPQTGAPAYAQSLGPLAGSATNPAAPLGGSNTNPGVPLIGPATARFLNPMLASATQSRAQMPKTGAPPAPPSALPLPNFGPPPAVPIGVPRISGPGTIPPAATNSGVPRITGSGPGAASSALRASRLPPAAAPATLTPEQKAKWAEILERANAIDNQNYFQMLGLPNGSSTDKIREAYFELVKKLHPDRLGPAFQPLFEQAQMVFRHVTEAHDTLVDDQKRMRYMNMMKDGGGTPAADRMVQLVLEASMEFQKAEVMLRRKDYDGAIMHARTAQQMAPTEADYPALIGWALFLKFPDVGAPLDEMVACLDRALQLDPKSDKIHFWRGMILRRVGRDAEALTHFEKAASLNPKNVEAVREVRLAKMRGQTVEAGRGKSGRDSNPPPPMRPGAPKRPSGSMDKAKPDPAPSAGGIFGGLFKKKP